MKSRKIDSFFKRKERDEEDFTPIPEPQIVLGNPRIEENINRVCSDDIENSLECGPRKRPSMWEYNVNQMNEIRRASLFKMGSISNEFRAISIICKRPSGRPGSDVFISTGFRGWKKVRNGKNCAFLKHIGKDPCSPHNNAMKVCQDLLNQDVCAFRGHDESTTSSNQGNFLELIKLLACCNDEVAKVVLENAPCNSEYTSHIIQKEILHILSSRVKKYIRKEIGDSKFCIIVDEAHHESKKEQMSLVLRFVDKDGFIQERFFGLARVNDTTSLTLKQKVCDIFSLHNLDVSNIHGQGYDGASHMRGERNGLQALFMKDCPYAYYVHCFAH
ncbi:uncharacterized protein LOC131650249 [Vicia villosa]|uniref:uncharacterized protein LOC131650249 n=1 Tax=Vicia villosa TaxID=3911 RepID=UPI00273BC390|nr:uncharacterized protein LOC131650249 [Vicia villosa]